MTLKAIYHWSKLPIGLWGLVTAVKYAVAGDWFGFAIFSWTGFILIWSWWTKEGWDGNTPDR